MVSLGGQTHIDVGLTRRLWNASHPAPKEPTDRDLKVVLIVATATAVGTATLCWFFAATATAPLSEKAQLIGWEYAEASLLFVEYALGFLLALVAVGVWLVAGQCFCFKAFYPTEKFVRSLAWPTRVHLFIHLRRPLRGAWKAIVRYVAGRFVLAHLAAMVLAVVCPIWAEAQEDASQRPRTSSTSGSSEDESAEPGKNASQTRIANTSNGKRIKLSLPALTPGQQHTHVSPSVFVSLGFPTHCLIITLLALLDLFLLIHSHAPIHRLLLEQIFDHDGASFSPDREIGNKGTSK